MSDFLRVFIAVVSTLLLAGCGGADSSEKTLPDAVSGATDVEPAKPVAEKKEVHICLRPIENPEDLWPRIEAVRGLDNLELKKNCGLEFLKIVGHWRVLPVDLLGPIVKEAALDGDALKKWVEAESGSNPKAAAMVVAMDIIGIFKVGDEPNEVLSSVKKWEDLKGSAAEIDAILSSVDTLMPLLKDVNKVHEKRCRLEVNPLGFAVKCTPIHPRLSQIELEWKTTLEDDLLKDLEVTACKGKSCKKLRKAALDLKNSYLALLVKVEKIKDPVFNEYLKSLMVLPPFKNN